MSLYTAKFYLLYEGEMEQYLEQENIDSADLFLAQVQNCLHIKSSFSLRGKDLICIPYDLMKNTVVVISKDT
jgi:hypothetical protein